MIGAKTTTIFHRKRLEKAMRRGSIEGLSRAAYVVRTVAMAGLRQRKGPSPAGTPPHTHSSRQGKYVKYSNRLKRAILYDVNKQRQSAVIGPAAHLVGQSGAMHEHGGRWKGQQFPKRAFMFPALQETAPKLPSHWAGSVR